MKLRLCRSHRPSSGPYHRALLIRITSSSRVADPRALQCQSIIAIPLLTLSTCLAIIVLTFASCLTTLIFRIDSSSRLASVRFIGW
jgi:hypothetical protein